MNRLAIVSTNRRVWLLGLALGAAAAASLIVGACPVNAAAVPRWTIRADTFPTDISPSVGGAVTVLAADDSLVPTDGTPVTITDVLPPGLTVTSIEANRQPQELGLHCEHTTTTVKCVYRGEETGPGEFEYLPLTGDNRAGLSVRIGVSVVGGYSGTLAPANVATVSGGGGAPASNVDSLVVSAQQLPFAPAGPFSAEILDSTGATDLQAGDHPNLDTTGFIVNTGVLPALEPSEEVAKRTRPVQALKSVAVELPAGLIGNPQATVTCPQYLVTPPSDGKECPPASVVGSVALEQDEGVWEYSGAAASSEPVKPLFNVTPEKGHPAQFAFIVLNQVGTLYANLVHSGGEYRVQVVSSSIPRVVHIAGVRVTFFGHPGAVDGSGTETPFFTNPTSCDSGPQVTKIYMDSWQAAGRVLSNGAPDLSDPAWIGQESVASPVSGCNRLSFSPEMTVQPSSGSSDAPSGLGVSLRVPQNGDSTGLATPDVKAVTVALPRGLVLSPSSAGGLGACSDEAFAATSTEPASCPESSAVGTVSVRTPVLANPLEGRVFVGAPECSPCSESDARSGRMVRLFVQVHSDEYGVTVKLPGRVSLDPVSGQLTARFEGLPQLPFDDFEFHFKEGPRAPLATPISCGTYAADVDVSPWSAPYTPDALLSPSFDIGQGCGARTFAPGLVAGTTSNDAGGFSPFTAAFSRSDGEQGLGTLQIVTPPGLLALLSSVPLCGEAQANAGTCPAASEIGHTSVLAGPGSQPVTVPEEGQPPAPVFLTTGYKGAPFGLSVVVPAIAGPYNLGTVVVRAAINVNPVTAQAVITSDPLPQSLDGVPLQVRTVNVAIDRPGFTFNPTNCNQLAEIGTVESNVGVAAGIADRFQAAGCTGLSFKPVLSATVGARASKANGASLDVRIAAHGGPTGGEANIRGVKVDLPIQLPSRTSTLNKACLAAVFATNPANCPRESDVGTATASTPVLATPLSGPAYLVSHGGAKFPDLEFVLQGEGIVLYVDGHTDIKKGVTSSNFDTVPDAPISSFELKLPTGKFSIVTSYLPTKANFDFCGQKLTMPTMITAQSGAVIKQTTKIGVSGCPKAKTTAKKAKKTLKKATKR